MKRLLILAFAAMLLLPATSHAYSISYSINGVDSGLSLTTSLLNGTLSVLAKTIGANSESQFSGTYMISADQGEATTLDSSLLTYSQSLQAVCNDDIKNSSDDITSVKLSVSRPWAFSTEIGTWDEDPTSNLSSFLGTLAVNTVYDFYGVFTNLASGYAEASFSLSVPTNSATPIPGAVWLLGTGLVGLMGLRRKVRN